ncbi:nucleoporin NUP53 [Colletotrichum spaethianum]|uniref:Nucleoporin NUP53 n=1 Tax=Colletotrichum spaethianum TaxID=700344 RepID=A0AA37LAR7_9PEZI|nr:nucleoporin NUP53 [Colletotrichum spaethianum]GKT42550.1 nucleoporin NUP53 [Colletotrichum spaethianum]
MAPLILHNVPDEELYIGDDGIKRPYAMVFPQQEGLPGARNRRGVAETGSFGKSTRRSRSRTGTPAGRRENPTVAAADKIFGDWISSQAITTNNLAASTTTGAGTNSAAAVPQRKTSGLSQAPLLASAADDTPAAAEPRITRHVPTEVILRGYRSPSQQYAAISHYEQLAGLICEDYPREPPLEQRRYKSELRDPAFTRRRGLTGEERAKVNRADGGEHWVKVTFESADAADAAVYASPQRVLGYLVYAEPYHGLPPARDEPIPDVDSLITTHEEHSRSQSVPAGSFGTHRTPRSKHRTASKSGSNPFAISNNRSMSDLSPPTSLTSSNTIETATISNTTNSSVTVTESQPQMQAEDSLFCRRIPTARKARLLPAEQALLPQQSYTQRLVNMVPFLKWFSGSMIGNEVPRTDNGDFDWNRASLYWKIIWWLDATFGLFGGEILSADKDD